MNPRHLNMRGKATTEPLAVYDRWFLFAVLGLLALGLLMVASSSIVISERQYHQPFHYLAKQVFFLGVGVCFGLIVLRLEIAWWEKVSGVLLLGSMILLVLVLIPGVGRSVNGSMRWIGFGPVGMQVSELAKLCVIVFMAGYLVRREMEIRTQVIGFIKPMAILCVVCLLLLKEPDFGAAVVIMATALTMMFMAGVRIWQFTILLLLVAGAIAFLAVSSPYRLTRLTTFINPWATQYDSGYQLTQSLIAFGRGGWFGVGLGDSVQKLFYLPEAHTDFLFAVLAEELGLAGVLAVFALFTLLIGRGLLIARRAQQEGLLFNSYFAYGLSTWLGLQAMINVGVNSGVLPTKGLTLPLMSYGGSSMLVNCIVIALLLRIDHETRWKRLGLT